MPKKILYFDCQSGICGNMVLGALLEIVDDEKYFLDELKKLNIGGYEIKISKKDSHGICGTFVNVIVDGEDEYGHVHHLDEKHEHSHNHEHHYSHLHRNLDDIYKIIDDSKLDENTKNLAKDIFLKVAEAEAKVHGKNLNEVHFHEVGAIDSIIDIVGTAILINKINPDEIISSVVNEGHGFIECAHGKMPVPVPATSQIFANENVKFRQIDVDTELVTPTGAAIISTLAKSYDLKPKITLEKIGFGAGSKDIGFPNLLKVYYGEIEIQKSDIYVIETNIDDSSGEILGYTMEKILNAGALDVSYTSIYMKKNRPAYKLEVICKKEDIQKLSEIIFNETTSIGVRFYKVDRIELDREIVEIDTSFGKIAGKKVQTPDGNIYFYPEYEEAKKVAIEKNLSLKNVYRKFL